MDVRDVINRAIKVETRRGRVCTGLVGVKGASRLLHVNHFPAEL